MLFQKQKDWWCSGPTATHCSGYTPLQVCKTGAINWRVTSVSPISTEIPGGLHLLSPHPFWEPTPLQPCQPPLRSEEHPTELQSRGHLLSRLPPDKNKTQQ